MPAGQRRLRLRHALLAPVAASVKFRKFVDVDFCSMTAKKLHVIEKHPELKSVIERGAAADSIVVTDHTDLVSPSYCLIGADLRNEKELRATWDKAGIDYRWDFLRQLIPAAVCRHCSSASACSSTCQSRRRRRCSPISPRTSRARPSSITSK